MNISKFACSFGLLLLSAFAVFATGQQADRIVYQKSERMLFSNPLEDYYKADPGKRPHFMIAPLINSTGNWRGYIATWEIEECRLYLKKVDAWLCKETKESCKLVELADLFPGKVVGSR
jgi:hypothetical protein